MNLMRTVTWATVATTGTIGGILLGFSAIVMPGLRRLPAPVAIQAMQAINLAAPRSVLLMVPLLGSAVGSAAVGLHALLSPGTPYRPLVITGAVAGLAVMGITAVYHVPRNNALAALDPAHPASAAAWLQYAAGWTAWNSVRAGAGLLAAALLTVAAVRSR